jgi:hypothetical protein
LGRAVGPSWLYLSTEQPDAICERAGATVARVPAEGVTPRPPRDLPHEVLLRLRDRSKAMFGNQDRIEVAVAITRVELGLVNATDLHRDVDVAVNRIRAQLLALTAMGHLAKTGDQDGKRMYLRVDDGDPFWAFVVDTYQRELELDEKERPSDLLRLREHLRGTGG